MLCNGHRVNHGAGIALEVPADYIFYGNAKVIQWLSARIASADGELNKMSKIIVFMYEVKY